MSAPFPRGETYVLYVPTSAGLRQKSTGTRSREIAKKVARLVEDLRDERDFDLLDAVGDKIISLGELYEAKVKNDLEGLRQRLRGKLVEDFIDQWLKIEKSNGLSAASVKLYGQRMRKLLPAGTCTHELTTKNVVDWLANVPGTSGTRRQYLNELSSLCVHLVRAGALAENPVARRDEVKRPRKNAPRTQWETADVDRRITDRLIGDMRIAALICVGASADRSTPWSMTVGDLYLLPEGTEPDPSHGIEHRVSLPGSKTAGRNRTGVRLEPWVVPALREWIAGKERTAPLIKCVKPRTLSAQWKLAAEREGKPGYTLKDSRHSYGC